MADNVFTMAQVRTPSARALAVSTGERMSATPDIPNMTESGVPMDLTGYFAAMVPTGTPQPIIDQIGKWMGQVVGSEDTRKFLAASASQPWVTTPAERQAYYLNDIASWKTTSRLLGSSSSKRGPKNRQRRTGSDNEKKSYIACSGFSFGSAQLPVLAPRSGRAARWQP